MHSDSQFSRSLKVHDDMLVGNPSSHHIIKGILEVDQMKVKNVVNVIDGGSQFDEVTVAG